MKGEAKQEFIIHTTSISIICHFYSLFFVLLSSFSNCFFCLRSLTIYYIHLLWVCLWSGTISFPKPYDLFWFIKFRYIVFIKLQLKQWFIDFWCYASDVIHTLSLLVKFLVWYFFPFFLKKIFPQLQQYITESGKWMRETLLTQHHPFLLAWVFLWDCHWL